MTTLEETTALVTSPATFMTAGNARITVKNTLTKNRHTYKVRKADSETPQFVRYFVSLMTGSSNEKFTYIGFINENGEFQTSRKSHDPQGAACRGFAWVWSHVTNLPEYVEIWHEGRCCQCGKALTDPKSIALGIGPVCRGE